MTRVVTLYQNSKFKIYKFEFESNLNFFSELKLYSTVYNIIIREITFRSVLSNIMDVAVKFTNIIGCPVVVVCWCCSYITLASIFPKRFFPGHSLFRHKRFILNELFQWNTSKICYLWNEKKPSWVFL